MQSKYNEPFLSELVVNGTLSLVAHNCKNGFEGNFYKGGLKQELEYSDSSTEDSCDDDEEDDEFLEELMDDQGSLRQIIV
jgi:hypothetical protein